MGTKLHKKRRYYKRSLTQDAYIFAPTGAVQPRRGNFFDRLFKNKFVKIKIDNFLDEIAALQGKINKPYLLANKMKHQPYYMDGKEFDINELNSSTASAIQPERVKC